MLLYKTRKLRGIFNSLLLDLPNEVRNKAAQPPQLMRMGPFHAARRISISKLLQCLAIPPSPQTQLHQSLRHTTSRDYVTPLRRLSLASACQHTCNLQQVQSCSITLSKARGLRTV
jgi:hypothetical protein